MTRRFVLRCETAGRFDDDLDAEVGPGDFGRVGSGEDAQLAPVDGETSVSVADRVRDRAVNGIVFEQVRERGRVGQIVDSDELNLMTSLQRGADDVPSD